MRHENRLLWTIFVLFISCNSTKTTADNQLDIEKTEIDLSTKVIQLERLEFSFDAMTIVPADPDKETIITDSQGNK